MRNIYMILLFCLCALNVSGDQLDSKGEWDEYYENTLNATKPSEALKFAEQSFERDENPGRIAVDLGTGTGRDALFLLDRGWNVLAIDAEALAIDVLLSRAPDEHRDRLDVNISSFSEMVLPQNVDLINASYSLPFCSPEEFPACWQNIVDHLAVGGRFSGQFFGDKDEWSSDPSLTFLCHEQMLQLFTDSFVVEYLEVQEGMSLTASGAMKYWHVFHVVAKKIK